MKSEATKSRLEELMAKKRMLKMQVKEEEKEPEEEVIVKFDFVATGSRDKNIIIWNAQRGQEIMKLEGHD